MPAVRLDVLGCGDAFGSGGRLQTSFLLESAQERFLIDCGATALIALRRAGLDPTTIGTVVLSHLHGDHFAGLPFLFLHAQHMAKRARPLVVAGPKGVASRVFAALDALFPGPRTRDFGFPLSFEELDPAREHTFGGLAVRPFPVEHPSGAPAYGLRLGLGGRTIAYSGDTQWTDTLLPLARDADLFLCECYAYDQDVKGHMNYTTLLARREQLRAKRILLTHLSEAMLARVGSLEIEAAHDGMVVDLP